MEREMKSVVRLSNAAERLGVKSSTLRDWFMKRKHLDFVKIGRAVCVTEDSIERLIAANTIPAREGRQ
jgi:excisionase family DNA binding protein